MAPVVTVAMMTVILVVTIMPVKRIVKIAVKVAAPKSVKTVVLHPVMMEIAGLDVMVDNHVHPLVLETVMEDVLVKPVRQAVI